MVLSFVQKLILAVLLAGIGICFINAERSGWDFEALKEMLKSRRILLKFLNYITILAVLTGIVLIPFAKTWIWFIVGLFLYILGIISNGLVFDFSRLEWVNKK